jgi:hypothetical protein
VSPERRYRLLLMAYPRSYRAERAEEMLQVLLAGEDRERASTRSAWAEGASLVRHGLAQRMRHQVLHAATSRGLAGASLLCVLAVLGARQLLASGLRGLGWDGYPDQWQLSVLWVDPRWPVHVLWLVTGLVLVLGRHRLAVLSARAAVVVHAWQLLAGASPALVPWPGDVGPHWVAPGGVAEAGWLVLTVAGAVMLGGPTTAGRAVAALPGRRWWSAGAVGVLGGGAMSVLALWTPDQGGSGLVDLVRGQGPSLVLASAVLGLGLVREPHGTGALALLGALAAVPLAIRWSAPMTACAAAALVFLAGYAVASLHRAADQSAPGSSPGQMHPG